MDPVLAPIKDNAQRECIKLSRVDFIAWFEIKQWFPFSTSLRDDLLDTRSLHR
jgi:hypothetical protein